MPNSCFQPSYQSHAIDSSHFFPVYTQNHVYIPMPSPVQSSHPCTHHKHAIINLNPQIPTKINNPAHQSPHVYSNTHATPPHQSATRSKSASRHPDYEG